jgi:succinate-semialdehyde dehydrogenase/glutarate-semialdehyde dehydrogenase
MRNGGEACTAANRFIVHEAHKAEFAERVAERLGAIRVGRGTDPAVEMGPLIDAEHRTRVAHWVDQALAGGATALCGGTALDGDGYFFAPTVLVGIDPSADPVGQEIFGPVAPIFSFGAPDEAIALANGTDYGLAAYVYTRDIGLALDAVDALEVGMIGINQGVISTATAPFGGLKQSGIGREGGREGIDEYLETKYVAITG